MRIEEKLSQGESIVVDCAYFHPHAAILWQMVNFNCFLSDVTNIRVNWRKLERRKFVRITMHLNKYFFPDEN